MQEKSFPQSLAEMSDIWHSALLGGYKKDQTFPTALSVWKPAFMCF